MKKYLVKDDSNKLLINLLDEDLQKIKEYCDNEYGEEKGNEHMIEQFYRLINVGLKLLKCENVSLEEVIEYIKGECK